MQCVESIKSDLLLAKTESTGSVEGLHLAVCGPQDGRSLHFECTREVNKHQHGLAFIQAVSMLIPPAPTLHHLKCKYTEVGLQSHWLCDVDADVDSVSEVHHSWILCRQGWIALFREKRNDFHARSVSDKIPDSCMCVYNSHLINLSGLRHLIEVNVFENYQYCDSSNTVISFDLSDWNDSSPGVL